MAHHALALFSGLKETNPLKAYLDYYNILEHYFEEAPALLSKNARTELEQLKCVMELLTTEADVVAKLTSIDPEYALQLLPLCFRLSGLASLEWI